MNKKQNKKAIIIVIILAVIIGGYLFYTTTKTTSGDNWFTKVVDKVKDSAGGSGFSGNRGNNGWWDATSGECWTTPTSLNGGKQEGGVSCCFDSSGYQVDCESDKRLSSQPVTFALYQPEGMAEIPNKYGVAHTITVSNPGTSGNLDFSKVFVESAVWTVVTGPAPANALTTLNANYSRIVGINSAYAMALPVDGPGVSFPAQSIDLQALSSNKTNPVTYRLTTSIKGIGVGGLINSTQVYTKTMKVTKEEAGFVISMTWGY